MHANRVWQTCNLVLPSLYGGINFHTEARLLVLSCASLKGRMAYNGCKICNIMHHNPNRNLENNNASLLTGLHGGGRLFCARGCSPVPAVKDIPHEERTFCFQKPSFLLVRQLTHNGGKMAGQESPPQSRCTPQRHTPRYGIPSAIWEAQALDKWKPS